MIPGTRSLTTLPNSRSTPGQSCARRPMSSVSPFRRRHHRRCSGLDDSQGVTSRLGTTNYALFRCTRENMLLLLTWSGTGRCGARTGCIGLPWLVWANRWRSLCRSRRCQDCPRRCCERSTKIRNQNRLGRMTLGVVLTPR